MTDRPVTIRQRTNDDLPALADALVRVHAVDGYPVEGVADPHAWLHHPHALHDWTAERDGQPIGQITLTAATDTDDAARVWHEQTRGDVATLTIPVRLFVDPAHRGAGAARLLMTTALDHARTLGRPVAFDVMTKDQAAIRLYESLGAQQIGQITHHHGDGLTEPAVVYVMPSLSSR